MKQLRKITYEVEIIAEVDTGENATSDFELDNSFEVFKKEIEDVFINDIYDIGQGCFKIIDVEYYNKEKFSKYGI